MNSLLAHHHYREKNKRLFDLVDKIRLWPSRTGVLHGVKAIRKEGESMIISTHCGCTFKVRDSKRGRGIRQLKHRNYQRACKRCGIPDWKLEKFKTK
ncbi:MAG: hypothetical protein LBP91_00365, partial [Coriobacteriales bacterium]|jgi:pyrrolysyl-tRNA synthetase-like protein|nr:hypothetical protein [Coriobacteriales bacterium]